MRRTKFKCKKCGCEFEKDAFELGEAEEKQVPTSPITCPKCGSTDLQCK